MDVDGISRGEEFAPVLAKALAGCSALLVAIGPEWLSCKTAAGTRELDEPDDWVRKEIRTALQRRIVVIPVLFAGAPLPGVEELPEDLRALRDRQFAPVTHERWAYDVRELIKALSKQTQLPIRDEDVFSANTGFHVLRDLITRELIVADAVGRSKEVIENTYAQVRRLALLKLIHDSLHAIEAECLRPLQAGGAGGLLRPFEVRFAGEARNIRQGIEEEGLTAVLRDELMDRLDATAAAFAAAAQAQPPGEADLGCVVGELNGLLAVMSPLLDVGIAQSAEELKLDRLVELMSSVKTTQSSPPAKQDPDLERFVQGIDALSRLRDDLNHRVAEHGRLQRLDTNLRAVCEGGSPPGTLRGEWKRIKRVRARLTPPFSPELAAVDDFLVAIESEIAAALGQGNEAAALDLVKEYFRAVSAAFRRVDGSLDEFLARLSPVGPSLKTVLDIL